MESLVGFDTLFGRVYKDKKVLVTGHSGFKGSWMTKWLEFMGAKVYGYSLKVQTQPNHISLLDFDAQMHEGDIRNIDELTNFVAKVEPEIVFHLAAQALVRDSYLNPVETYSTNVMGTLHLLEACRKTPSVRAIVVITSDKCYENREQIWGYRENEAMGGYDPYSSSKGCAELLVSSYRNSYFNVKDYGIKHSVLLASARAGNVIGGGDWANDRLIPDIVRAASKAESVFIRNPLATRPWQHVLEPISGYLTLGWKLLENKVEYADGWNFGPSQESNLTVNEIVQYSQNYWTDISIEYSKKPGDAHEANLLMLDCSKANKIMHWSSVWDIDNTIKHTIGWYKDFYNNRTVNTLIDISKYVDDAKKLKVVWTR